MLCNWSQTLSFWTVRSSNIRMVTWDLQLTWLAQKFQAKMEAGYFTCANQTSAMVEDRCHNLLGSTQNVLFNSLWSLTACITWKRATGTFWKKENPREIQRQGWVEFLFQLTRHMLTLMQENLKWLNISESRCFFVLADYITSSGKPGHQLRHK